MPREPFLTRIGLGRSPFLDTPSIIRSPYYFQVAAGEEIPHDVLHADDGRYIQLYDEHGHPINPLAEDLARRYRHALNEIMAATGVVEKCPPPSANLPGPTDEFYKEMERDGKCRWWLDTTFDFVRMLSKWWIECIGARICTFDFPHSMPLAEIIVSEYQLSGPSIFYAGMSMRALYYVTLFVYSRVEWSRPVERMLRWVRVPRIARAWAARFSGIPLYITALVVKTPFWRLEILQRLDLLPTKTLPPWSSIFQWTNLFPPGPSELHLTMPVFLELAKAVPLSPPALLLLCGRWLMWVRNGAEWHLTTMIMSPATVTSKSSWIKWTHVNASQNTWSYRMLRGVVDRMLRVLRWRSNAGILFFTGQGLADVEISGTVVTNLQPVLPGALPGAPPPGQFLPQTADGGIDDLDPSGQPICHRITMLSTLPAKAVAGTCARFVGGVAQLPLSVIVYRLLAAQYLSIAGGRLPAGRPRYRLLEPLAELRSMDVRSLGILLSRLALLEGLGLAIDLGLFFCQWALATYVGKKHFGWGGCERDRGKWAYYPMLPSYASAGNQTS